MPFDQIDVFILIFLIGIILFVIIRFLSNQTRRKITRSASVINRQISEWGRSTRHYLTFRTLDTGEVVELRIYWFNMDLFEVLNINDIGDLTTRGSRFINFIRTKKRNSQNSKNTPPKVFANTVSTSSKGSIFKD